MHIQRNNSQKLKATRPLAVALLAGTIFAFPLSSVSVAKEAGIAVPSSDANKGVTDQIKDCVVQRGWLGVTIQTITKDIASSLGLVNGDGVIVASVSEDSPASKAGLEPGDIIRSVDGETVKTAHDLSQIIAKKAPKDDVKLKIRSNGKAVTMQVTLNSQPGEKVASTKTNNKAQAKLGLMIQNSKKGVVVAGVQPGSPAAEKGMKPGDIIKKVDGRQIKMAKDVREAVVEATRDGNDRVLMLVEGQDGSHFVVVKVKRG
jgi:serine protease Do